MRNVLVSGYSDASSLSAPVRSLLGRLDAYRGPRVFSEDQAKVLQPRVVADDVEVEPVILVILGV